MLHLIPITVMGFATVFVGFGAFLVLGNIAYVVVDKVKNPEPKLPDAVVRYLEKNRD